MELKPECKQSEWGIIPGDWLELSIYQFGKPVRGGSPRPAGDARFFNGNHIPWLTVAALTNIPASQLVVMATATSLTEEGASHSRTLEVGTLIIANSGATLGVAKILGVRCCANDGIAAILDLCKSISARYLAHFINTKTSYLRNTVATGNGQPNLNTGLIGNFKIALPPTKAEQEAIAEALSDADALIESLEQLLAKKRHIKQGAMQELLTGKTRLPGFTFEWRSVPFADVVDCRKDRIDPRRVGAQDFCIELEHLEQGTGRLRGSCVAGPDASLKSTFRKGDVLFGKLRAYLRKFWLADQAGACSTEIWVLVPKPSEITPEFLFQLVKLDRFIEAASTAYGTHMPRSDWNVIKVFEVQLPAIGEQVAIAAILSEMEVEIDMLEAKLTKVRNLKQAMMQELLTGRIRLL